MYISDIQERK